MNSNLQQVNGVYFFYNAYYISFSYITYKIYGNTEKISKKNLLEFLKK